MTRLGDWFRSQLRAAGFQLRYTNGDIIHILQQVEDGMRSGRFASSAWNGKGIDPIAPAFSLTGKSDRWYYSAMQRSVQDGKGAPKKGNATAWKGWMDGAPLGATDGLPSMQPRLTSRRATTGPRTDDQAARLPDAVVRSRRPDPCPNRALARPPPTRQTARKGRLNFLYLCRTR